MNQSLPSLRMLQLPYFIFQPKRVAIGQACRKYAAHNTATVPKLMAEHSASVVRPQLSVTHEEAV